MSPTSAVAGDGPVVEQAYDILAACSAEDDIEDLFAIQAEALLDE
ncbi:MAG TPA: hypothetical protein VLX28_20435 [Thermoanaerobaculia bacterium]|nr:hypothetical protein [Thermoanaerobaculia bacterium]